MVVRMRNVGLVGKVLGPGRATLCKNLDKAGALAGRTENLPEGGVCVRAASLRHPDREAPKDHRAPEPKWMKDGLTTSS
jgi:hypothetical protein